MAIQLPQGFKIGSIESIDSRILLTKAEMLAVNENIMPQNYFCICKDDSKLYIWNKTFDKTAELGRFRPYEEILNMAQAITEALQDPTKRTEFLSAMTDMFNDEHFDIIDQKIDLAISVIQAIGYVES